MKLFIRELFQVNSTRVFIALISILLFLAAKFIIFENKSNEDNEDSSKEMSNYELNKKIITSNKLDRLPASVISKERKSKITNIDSIPEISTKDESHYNTPDYQSSYISNSKNELNQPRGLAPISTQNYSNNFLGTTDDIILPKKTGSENKSDSEVFLGSSIKKTSNETSTNSIEDLNNVMNSTSGDSLHSTENACNTDILSGSFGNPIGVAITCNYLSNIKYCLSKDVCCDPQISGLSYNGAISIGAENGNFCLSFYGESDTGGTTDVVQNSYTINNTYPNLVVGSPKTFYQTTELTGETFITSTDFGKNNFYAGQINFKATDPTATGLNYSCKEIAENDHLNLSPIPSTTLTLFDISGLLPINEIIIPFRGDQFDYGINFLSSYIKNDSYVIPTYSCSTVQIFLEDFNYFESSIAQSSSGNNSAREFEGQFMSYGFFEEDALVFRSPAGESTNEKNGTILESGLISIFY